jgi:hypothetical protein
MDVKYKANKKNCGGSRISIILILRGGVNPAQQSKEPVMIKSWKERYV